VKGQPTNVGKSALRYKRAGKVLVSDQTKEACEMQTTEAYLGLIRERSKRGLPLERVYRQLFNRNLYLTAYGKIYRNAGSMTPGVTDETADGMSLSKIDSLIETLRFERYQWKPARRTSHGIRNEISASEERRRKWLLVESRSYVSY